MTQTTHDLFVSSTINLAELTQGEVPIGRQLLIDDGSSLDGNAYKVYESVQTARDDNASGFLTDFGLAAVEAAIGEGQQDIVVAAMDSTGGDTYTGVLSSMRDADVNYLNVHIDSRDPVDIEGVSQSVETQSNTFELPEDLEVFFGQTGLTDVKDTQGDTLPASLADADEQEWTFLRWHDDGADPSEVRWAANRLRYDLDETSPPMEGPMKNGTPLLSNLTKEKRKNILDKDVAVGLSRAASDVNVAEGVNTNGRAGYEIFTAVWFITRVVNELNEVRVDYEDVGQKIPINREGQQIVRNNVNQFLENGEDAGHFDEIKHTEVRESDEEALIEFPDISPSDISNRRIRFKVKTFAEVDALRFEPDVYFDRAE